MPVAHASWKVRKKERTHLSIVKVEESSDFTHHIQRIALNLHASHSDHVSSDAQKFLFSHFSCGGNGISIYESRDNASLTMNLKVRKLNRNSFAAKRPNYLTGKRFSYRTTRTLELSHNWHTPYLASILSIRKRYL